MYEESWCVEDGDGASVCCMKLQLHLVIVRFHTLSQMG